MTGADHLGSYSRLVGKLTVLGFMVFIHGQNIPRRHITSKSSSSSQPAILWSLLNIPLRSRHRRSASLPFHTHYFFCSSVPVFDLDLYFIPRRHQLPPYMGHHIPILSLFRTYGYYPKIHAHYAFNHNKILKFLAL